MYGTPMEWVTILLNRCKWTSISGHIWHKVSQILDQAKKPLHIVLVPRSAPLADAGHLVRICMYTSVINNMTKAVHSFRVEIEFALLEI